MKWDKFYEQIAGLSVVDLPLVQQVLAKPKTQVVQQLHRWVAGGRVISLRRGLYALSPTFQKRPLSPLHVANELYRPSYLSALWAMGFFGLIPERVVLFTSVTSRVTRRFINDLGEFAYSNIRRDLFMGFSKREIDGFPVWIADPAKSLLDFWHLNPGEWSGERMEEMRFQGFDAVDREKLVEYSAGYPPRVRKAARAWIRLADSGGGEA